MSVMVPVTVSKSLHMSLAARWDGCIKALSQGIWPSFHIAINSSSNFLNTGEGKLNFVGYDTCNNVPSLNCPPPQAHKSAAWSPTEVVLSVTRETCIGQERHHARTLTSTLVLDTSKRGFDTLVASISRSFYSVNQQAQKVLLQDANWDTVAHINPPQWESPRTDWDLKETTKAASNSQPVWLDNWHLTVIQLLCL